MNTRLANVIAYLAQWALSTNANCIIAEPIGQCFIGKCTWQTFTIITPNNVYRGFRLFRWIEQE